MISASSSPRAARPAPRSLRISRKRSGVGLAHDVVDQVEVDRLAVALERQQVLALARLAVGDLLELAAAARCPAARGWVGSHSTNFSPISDCGRIRQEASSRKSWKPGSSIRSTTHRLAGLGAAVLVRGLVVAGDVDLGDRADLGAGDPHLLAGDQEGGVVEDRADLVGALVAAGAGADDQDRHRGGERDRGSPATRLMVPAGTSVGVADARRARRRRGTGGRSRPAESACVAPPGQRLNGPSRAVEVVELLRWRDRVEHARWPRSSRRGSIPAGWTRSVVAVGVVVAGDAWPKLAEEGEQVGRVGAQLGDVRAGSRRAP